MAKQLFIVYDKHRYDNAIMLLNLISTKPEIKASIYTVKEIKQNKLVSREKCLYIGRDCSSDIQFNDMYEKWGIHIGTIGTKAWIRCEPFEFDNDELHLFEENLMYYCNKFKMESVYSKEYLSDRPLVLRQFLLGEEPWKDNIIKRVQDKGLKNKGAWRFGDLFLLVDTPSIYFENYLNKNRNTFNDKTAIRKYQYTLAVLIFFGRFFNQFMKIDDEQPNASSQTETNEKKK